MKIIIKSDSNFRKEGGEKRMKYSKLIIAVVAAGLTLGTYVSSQAVENVRESKHNLSSSRTIDGNVKFTDTAEVCVFCHTPHGGRTDVAGGAAPIWNRALSTASYVMYKSPNFDTTFTGTDKPQGVSVACLSCHDGTVAFDALINLPGRGGFQGTTPGTAGYNKGTSTLVDGDNSFNETTATPFPNLGTDLSNDHPISMEIPTTDPQFSEIITNLDTTALTAGHVSPLRRGAVSTLPADKRDMIRAYPTVAGKAYIECASCHNPHENTATRFLRYPSATPTELTSAGLGDPSTETDRNKGSLLCLSCHQK